MKMFFSNLTASDKNFLTIKLHYLFRFCIDSRLNIGSSSGSNPIRYFIIVFKNFCEGPLFISSNYNPGAVSI